MQLELPADPIATTDRLPPRLASKPPVVGKAIGGYLKRWVIQYVAATIPRSYDGRMECITTLLAKLESDPDNERWIEHAQVAMLQLAERYRPGAEPFDRLAYERDVEALERLAGLIRERHKRLKEMLPPAG